MGQVIDEPATYADIETLPPNVVGEILFGKLVAHPRPAPPFDAITFSLGDLWPKDLSTPPASN